MFSRTILLVLAAASSAVFVSAQGSGDATYYDAGMGACGISNSDSDSIVAVSVSTFDGYPGAGPNPNKNPICNQGIEITYNGVTKLATITDRCVGCQGASIDMTPTLFQAFAPLGIGRLHGVSWKFVAGGGSSPPPPPPPPSSGGGGGCPGGWSAGAVYTQGQTASFNGHSYTAQWWTQGNQPGTAEKCKDGSNGCSVWKDNGSC